MPQTSQITADAGVARHRDAPLRRVGPWELVRLIGEGSMGRVYQARPMGAAKDAQASYAIKMLRAPWTENPRGLEMLAREARIGQKICNPHLLPVLACNLDEPPYFLVMPLLEGETFASRLRRDERPSVPVALWIARQIAEALEALSVSGWMHADLKPSNIFVSLTHHATLIDLSLARHPGEMVAAPDRPVVGTLAYMAPERIVSTLRADVRSDIYSLGVTLYEALTGRLPFEGNDMTLLAAQHCQELPADLRVLAPQLPTHVARLIRQMLAKEPLRRPQTPSELIERLTALEIETFADRLSL